MEIGVFLIFDRDFQQLAALSSDPNQSPGACRVFRAPYTREINGALTLDIQADGSHEDAQHLQPEHYVVIEDPEYQNEYLLFIIREVKQEADETDPGQRYITAECEDVAIQELNDNYVEDRRPSDPDTALQNALENTMWDVGRVEVGGRDRQIVLYHLTPMEAIQKLIETWGGEVKFRVTLDETGKITGRYVDWLEQIGGKPYNRIQYSLNAERIHRTTVTRHIKTALIGRGMGEETDTGGYGRRIMFTNHQFSKKDGFLYDKPAGQMWVGDPEALQRWGIRNEKTGKLEHRFGYYIVDGEEDITELYRATEQQLKEISQPLVNFQIDCYDLANVPGYEHMFVRTGDTNYIIDDGYSPAIEVEGRIIRTVRDLADENRVTEIEVGNIITDITDQSRSVEDRLKDVVRREDPIGWFKGVIDLKRVELLSGNTYTYWDDTGGISTYDRPIDQNPTKCMRIVAGGWLCADRFDPQTGDWDFQTMADGSGMYANQIFAGQMRAERLGAGNITVGGAYGPGNLWFKNAQNEITMHFDGQAGSVDRMHVDRLTSPTVIQTTTPEQERETQNIYVDALNGEDVGADGTDEDPLKTLSRALQMIPKSSNATFTIWVRAGSNHPLFEHVEINGFTGDGAILIRPWVESSVESSWHLYGWIRMSGSTQKVEMFDPVIIHDGTLHSRNEDDGANACIFALRSNTIQINRGRMAGAQGKSRYGIVSTQGAVVECYDTEFYGYERYALYATKGGSIITKGCKGGSPYQDSYGARSTRCGMISIEAADDGVYYFPLGMGGYISNAATGQVLYSGTAQLRPGSVSFTYPPHSSRRGIRPVRMASYRMQSSGKGSYDGGSADNDDWGVYEGQLFQGAPYFPQYYEELESGAPKHRTWGNNTMGVIWINGANFSAARGKNIRRFAVRIRRLGKFGGPSPANLQIGYHTMSQALFDQNAGKPDWGINHQAKELTKIGPYRSSDDIWAELPEEIYTPIINGTATGLVFWNDDFTQAMEIDPQALEFEFAWAD